jgi:hypothetical protein
VECPAREHGHRAAPRTAVHGCRLAPGSVHDGADVVHLELEKRRFGTAVGQPIPSHVEQDQTRERRRAIEVASPSRLSHITSMFEKMPVV